MTSENVHDDIQSRHTRPQSVMPGSDRASFLLQGFGRVGAGGAKGLPEY